MIMSPISLKKIVQNFSFVSGGSGVGAKTKCDPGNILKSLILSGVTIVIFVRFKTFKTRLLMEVSKSLESFCKLLTL